MRFLLGLLLGYSIRGKKPFLIATLTAIAFVAFVCFIVLPAIALIPLAISVRRERLSRPPQTTVPVVVGLNYKTAQIKVRALVTERVGPGTSFIPFHFGGWWQGKDLLDKYPEGAAPIVRGDAVNTGTTYGYDSVTMMQETKTTLCNIERA